MHFTHVDLSQFIAGQGVRSSSHCRLAKLGNPFTTTCCVVFTRVKRTHTPIIGKWQKKRQKRYQKNIKEKASEYYVDIADRSSILVFKDKILSRYGRVDILINNAANDPKVKDSPDEKPW